MKRVLTIVVLLIVLVLAGGAAYLKLGLPDVAPAPQLKVDITSERIAHGEYLANHVTVCMDCHSTRDWSRFAAPLVPGTLGKGGELFNQQMGFPGTFYSKNITPEHLAGWTDGEIYRTITTGVDKNDDALFPVMPFSYFANLDKEDVYDIIAYIRSLPAIKNGTPVHEVDFPMNFILNTIPKNVPVGKKPARSESAQYGAYLVSVAACMECHTQAKKGQIIPELAFAGGREFVFPNGVTRSANLTPDMATGIGSWTENQFLARFKAYMDTTNLRVLGPDELNTPMPWAMYGGMDSSDLKAIYAYLRTLKPIKNQVPHFTVANAVASK
jgi:mono/diheme cytochrome c family protein